MNERYWRRDTVKIDTDKWMSLVSGRRRGILPALLRMSLAVASVPYSLTMRIRNLCYDFGWLASYRVDVPVVVVGNLTAGGTGKTPAVEYIARLFRQQDRQVAILSRGYGAVQGRNDEALVLETNLVDVPHLQDADRVKSARTAIEELESDLLVLDDGFQHRRLTRDFDVVLIDATAPWGYGWCLPRGLLREPRSGLRRAGAVLVTRTDQVKIEQLSKLIAQIRQIAPQALVALAQHTPQSLQNISEEITVDQLQGRTVAAFCGIGNPESFFKTLESLGAKIIEKRVFPDHYNYQRSDVQALESWTSQLPKETWLLTTQKDWVKLRVDQLGDKPLWSLRVAMEITQGRSALESALLKVIGREGRDGPFDQRQSDSSLPLSGKEAYDYATVSPV